MEEIQPSSNAYTYAPIDPFKPSIAFSLRKFSAQEDTNILEDDRPPIRRRPQSRPVHAADAPANFQPAIVYFPQRNPTPSPPPPPRSYFQSRPSPSAYSPAHLPPGGSDTQARPSTPHHPRHSHSSSRSCSPVRSYYPPLKLAALPTLPLAAGVETGGKVQHHVSTPSGLPLNPTSSHRSATPPSASAPSHPRARQDDVSGRPVTPPKAGSPFPLLQPAKDVDSDTTGSPRRAVQPRCAYDLASSPELSRSSNSFASYEISSASTSPEAVPQLNHASAPSGAVAAALLPRREPLEISFNNNEKSDTKPPPDKNNEAYAYAAAFVLDTLPRQIYLNLLLRLPYLYFSRVTRIFEEAEMSMPMIRQGILDAARARARVGADANANGKEGRFGPGKYGDVDRQLEVEKERFLRIGQKSLEPDLTMMDEHDSNLGYVNLQVTWLAFVDALLKEWKTLNIISVLLLSAILTLLQIQSIANDPVTRYSALLSMICALISLIYGCIYIIRFGTMKKTYKGAAWAQEAQRQKAGIWWNIWVMLALPATWLAWSVILYITTITAFIWRSSPYSDLLSSSAPIAIPSATSPQLLIPRLLLTGVLAMGVVYSALIASTLRRYGESMDRAWQERIWGWMRSERENESGYDEGVREVWEAGNAGGGVGDAVVCRCNMCIGGGVGVGVNDTVNAVNVDVGAGVFAGAGDEIRGFCRCEACVRFGPVVDERVNVVDADAYVGDCVDGHGYVGSLTKEWVEDHLARRTDNEDYDHLSINEDVTHDIAGEGSSSKVRAVSAVEHGADVPPHREDWPSDPAPLAPILEHEDELEHDISYALRLGNVVVRDTGAVGGSLSTLGLSFVEEEPKSTTPPPALTGVHQTDSTTAEPFVSILDDRKSSSNVFIDDDWPS